MYITSTASERIMDTLECLPHKSPITQISSTDRLLMAAHDMNDALKHPHTYVPFSTIGDEKSMALTTLGAIFKNNFKKPLASVIIGSPIKDTGNKRPALLIQKIITSPTITIIKQDHKQN
jgi:hypothetical protein